VRLERGIARLARGIRAGENRLFHQSFNAPGTVRLTSPAFAEGQPIPRRHLGQGLGDNVSPELGWSNLPEQTRGLGFVIEDADAPAPSPFIHALAYAPVVPPDALPEDALSPEFSVVDLRRGANTQGKARYAGPTPPSGHGLHRYVFQIFALDSAPQLADGFSRKELRAALLGHVLAWGRLTGIVERT
jgi:Raf kinase inhibitor-like YbhB/YbcL family protein